EDERRGKGKVWAAEVENLQKPHSRCQMRGRRRQYARREPSLDQRAKNFRRPAYTDHIHVPVGDPIESRQKEQRSEVSVAADRPGDQGLPSYIADLLDLRTGVHGKIKPAKRRAQDNDIRAPAGCRYGGCSADLRHVDGSPEHRLNRSGTRDVDQLCVETILFEKL